MVIAGTKSQASSVPRSEDTGINQAEELSPRHTLHTVTRHTSHVTLTAA